MKRAARNIVGSALLQSHEVTYDISNLSRIQNTVYRFMRDHSLLFINSLVIGHIIIAEFMYFIFVNHLLHLP